MNPTILLVFAHPDDETFTCGGTVAHYSRQGVRIVLYCATRGEAGSTGSPPLCSQEELGDVRVEELKQAADILGIHRVIVKDYGDGKLNQSLLKRLEGDIAGLIGEERPAAVITFPPEGISGHLDHRAVQEATYRAVRNHADGSAPTLYYIAIPESNTSVRSLYATPDDRITHRIEVSSHRKTIMEALRQHRTQHQSIERVFPGVLDGNWERLRTHEFFQAVNPNSVISDDELL